MTSEAQETWRTWEAQDVRNLLIKCVGYQFGERPDENLPAIRESRGAYGQTVAHRMSLRSNDVVLDLGSGCGFVGRVIAPMVKMLYCADLSHAFLEFCRHELEGFPNVSCHLIDYADLSPLHARSVSKVYSTAVWIHFNFYDMFHYLTALNALLPIGGMIYFDYADPDGIKFGGAHFRAHAATYRGDRTTIPCLLNYNSREAVEAALDLTGFELAMWWRTHEYCCSCLVRKIRNG